MDALANDVSVQVLLASALPGFCIRWKITELALFGSALRSDFQQDSDVDLLVTFAEDASWSLLDHIAMQQELQGILGRDVDLVSRRALMGSENYLRRDEILNNMQVIYSAFGETHEPG